MVVRDSSITPESTATFPEMWYNMLNMETLRYTKKLLDANLTFLTLPQIQQILGIQNVRTTQSIVRKLVKTGFLKRLEKGKYLLTTKDAQTFQIAQFLYQPSYISLETALSFYGIMPQFPMEITSVSPKKPKVKVVDGFTYSYSKIAKSLFIGYTKGDGYLIALKEKALFDYLYFIAKGLKTKNYLDEFDKTSVAKLKVRAFLPYVKHVPTRKKVAKLIEEVYAN